MAQVQFNYYNTLGNKRITWTQMRYAAAIYLFFVMHQAHALPQNKIDSAITHFWREEYTVAQLELSQLIINYPDNTLVNYYLGKTLFALGKEQESLSALQIAARDRHLATSSYLLMGTIAARTGDRASAAYYFQSSLESAEDPLDRETARNQLRNLTNPSNTALPFDFSVGANSYAPSLYNTHTVVLKTDAGYTDKIIPLHADDTQFNATNGGPFGRIYLAWSYNANWAQTQLALNKLSYAHGSKNDGESISAITTFPFRWKNSQLDFGGNFQLQRLDGNPIFYTTTGDFGIRQYLFSDTFALDLRYRYSKVTEGADEYLVLRGQSHTFEGGIDFRLGVSTLHVVYRHEDWSRHDVFFNSARIASYSPIVDRGDVTLTLPISQRWTFQAKYGRQLSNYKDPDLLSDGEWSVRHDQLTQYGIRIGRALDDHMWVLLDAVRTENLSNIMHYHYTSQLATLGISINFF